MATFSNPGLIKTMLLNDGYYPGDPQPARIYSYKIQDSKQVYAVFYNAKDDDVATSPFVHSYLLLWNKHDGLTHHGREWLANHEDTQEL